MGAHLPFRTITEEAIAILLDSLVCFAPRADQPEVTRLWTTGGVIDVQDGSEAVAALLAARVPGWAMFAGND